MITRLLSTVLVTAVLAGMMLFWWEGGFEGTPTQKAQRELSEGEQKALALGMWRHASRGTGSKLEKILIGITFLNEEKHGGGRDLETLFQYATIMLPPSERSSKTIYYSVRVVSGETYVFGRTSYSQTVTLANELIQARNDVAKVLPDNYKHLACVTRVVRAQGQGFTRRLGLSSDQLARKMEAEGLELKHTSQDGVRFYCPK